MNSDVDENYSQSDFSEASLVSLGRSVQADDRSESSYLFGGPSVQTVQPERMPGKGAVVIKNRDMNSAFGATLCCVVEKSKQTFHG